MTRLLLVLVVLLGVLVGVGGYTFHYAHGLSYFSEDPTSCANCHIMQDNLDSWNKSVHHAVATCNDCHLPPSGIAKYMAKADNGWRHSKAFTLDDFHEPIMLTPQNRKNLQDNCIRCHQDMVTMLVHGSTTDPKGVQCIQCHAGVGHGPRR